jgi:hypothetical protein
VADPVVAAANPPSLPPPPPASVARDRTRDAVHARLDPLCDAVLAGTQEHYTRAADLQRARQVETTFHTPNTDASFARAQRPRPSALRDHRCLFHPAVAKAQRGSEGSLDA